MLKAGHLPESNGLLLIAAYGRRGAAVGEHLLEGRASRSTCAKARSGVASPVG
jgi:hypothetical protein